MNLYDLLREIETNRKLYNQLNLKYNDLRAYTLKYLRLPRELELKIRRLSFNFPTTQCSTRSYTVGQPIDDDHNSTPVVAIHEVSLADIHRENKLLRKLLITFEREIKLYKGQGIETPKRPKTEPFRCIKLVL